MSKRKYGYVVLIRKKAADEYETFAVMEALKISPYAIDTGYKTSLDTFSDEIAPSGISKFISEMGEPDSFSFIKFSDLTSLDLMNAQTNPEAFDGYASLAVISLSKVPKNLSGRARLAYIVSKGEAFVDLDDCMVLNAWTNIKGQGQPPVDIITLAGSLRIE